MKQEVGPHQTLDLLGPSFWLSSLQNWEEYISVIKPLSL